MSASEHNAYVNNFPQITFLTFKLNFFAPLHCAVWFTICLREIVLVKAVSIFFPKRCQFDLLSFLCFLSLFLSFFFSFFLSFLNKNTAKLYDKVCVDMWWSSKKYIIAWSFIIEMLSLCHTTRSIGSIGVYVNGHWRACYLSK